MSIQILVLPPEEWPRYRELRLEALRLEPQAFGASFAENAIRPEAFWRDRLAEDSRGWLLFARVDGTIAGMIGTWPGEGGTAELISMYVTPALRGRGVAGRLLDAALERLRAGGFLRAILAVNVDQTAAVALYRSRGFGVTGEGVAITGDGLSHGQLHLRLELRPPATR